jgi:hypothetical protein
MNTRDGEEHVGFSYFDFIFSVGGGKARPFGGVGKVFGYPLMALSQQDSELRVCEDKKRGTTASGAVVEVATWQMRA